MSEVTSILTGRINLKRLTALVLDQTAIASSISPTRQPDKTVRFEVQIIGATVGSGRVNIAGSTTETFIFSQNGTQVGTKDFTSVSGITLSGITQGFIKIRAVNPMGQPVNKEITVSSSLPVRFFTQAGRIKTIAPGEQQVAQIRMMAEPDADVQNLDNIEVISGIVGVTNAQLDFVECIYDFDGATHHLESVVKQP